jgi:hypothetical protein
MKSRLIVRVALLCVAMFGVMLSDAMPQAPKSSPKPAVKTNLNDLSMEIAALQTLCDLELTPTQLTGFTKLARESAAKGERREPAKTSPEFAAALTNLHAAYVKGNETQIGDCREKLDALTEKEKEEPELDNGVNITEGALSNAADALKLLNVRQTGAFLATLELTDPAELLISSMEQVREIKSSKDLDQEIATVAEEVAWLLHGTDEAEGQKTKDKVTAMLQRAGKAGGAGNRKAMENEARQVVGDVDNMEVISHILEHGMAEFLSNPRLEAAIRVQSRIASRPAAPKKTPSGKSSK